MSVQVKQFALVIPVAGLLLLAAAPCHRLTHPVTSDRYHLYMICKLTDTHFAPLTGVTLKKPDNTLQPGSMWFVDLASHAHAAVVGATFLWLFT